jgi:hypothetical protein
VSQALVVYLIAMRPFRSAIASVTRKAISLFSRKIDVNVSSTIRENL